MDFNLRCIYLPLLMSAILLLANCSNNDLYDKLSNPASIANSGGNGPGGPPATIYLFSPVSTISGNLGGRAAADGTCVTARNSNTFPDNRCSNVHAVVSIASVDNLANMPGTYGLPTNQPILGPTIGPSGMIAQNWNSFINGALNNSLTAAGALPSLTSWWSFTAASGGTQTANNCSNGMSTTGNADVGSSTSTSTTAINSGTTTSCLSPQQQLLCVCF